MGAEGGDLVITAPPPEPATDDLDTLALATPVESTEDAIELVLEWIAANGRGRWTVGNVALQELDPLGSGLLPIAVPATPRLLALRREGDGPSDGHVTDPIVTMAGRLIATLLSGDHERARLSERVATAEQESTIEPLTGLPNARAFWRHLSREAARCDRHGTHAGVVVIDLDDLKETNDTEGHLAGDMLIRRAAGALQSCLRAGDFVARVGGDEFAVVAVGVEPDALDSVVDKVSAALERDSIAASVGVALYEPGSEIDAVFDRADRAMYEAKRRRRVSA